MEWKLRNREDQIRGLAYGMGIQVNGEKRGTSSNGKRETLLIDINKPHA